MNRVDRGVLPLLAPELVWDAEHLLPEAEAPGPTVYIIETDCPQYGRLALCFVRVEYAYHGEMRGTWLCQRADRLDVPF